MLSYAVRSFFALSNKVNCTDAQNEKQVLGKTNGLKFWNMSVAGVGKWNEWSPVWLTGEWDAIFGAQRIVTEGADCGWSKSEAAVVRLRVVLLFVLFGTLDIIDSRPEISFVRS